MARFFFSSESTYETYVVVSLEEVSAYFFDSIEWNTRFYILFLGFLLVFFFKNVAQVSLVTYYSYLTAIMNFLFRFFWPSTMVKFLRSCSKQRGRVNSQRILIFGHRVVRDGLYKCLSVHLKEKNVVNFVSKIKINEGVKSRVNSITPVMELTFELYGKVAGSWNIGRALWAAVIAKNIQISENSFVGIVGIPKIRQ